MNTINQYEIWKDENYRFSIKQRLRPSSKVVFFFGFGWIETLNEKCKQVTTRVFAINFLHLHWIN